MRKKILIFARDPGGANAVAPLYEYLNENNYCAKLYGKDFALKKFESFQLNAQNIMESISEVSMEEIEKFLATEKPDLIITATSADDFTEKFIWNCAKSLKISSFAILDQWINYGIRFSKYSVNELEEYNLEKKHEFLPDKIFVMDDYAKKMICKEGISENNIEVTGSPYFDYLISKKISALSNKNNKKDTLKIIYASEPITDIYKESDESGHYWGYTEKTIFNSVFKSLSEVIENLKIDKISLIIKQHPKEKRDNYKEISATLKNKKIDVKIDNESSFFDVVSDADLIIGMSSMFLIESAVVGIPILSVQIGLIRDNPFILDKIDAIKSILDIETLKSSLFKLLIEKEKNGYTYHIKSGATTKILNKVDEILCQN